MIKSDVKRLFDEGKSYGVIAKELGISRNAVAGHCNRGGWKRGGEYGSVKLPGAQDGHRPDFTADERFEWRMAAKNSIFLADTTQSAVAGAAGLSRPFLSGVLNGHRSFSSAMCRRIEAAIEAVMAEKENK